MRLSIYSDGGARGNPGPGAIGVVVCDSEGRILAEHKDCIGEVTNNVAEYLGLIAAHELARELQADQVTFYMDSELVVRQMRGEYKVKDENLKKLWQIARESDARFSATSYAHLPRTHTFMKKADRLVNRALDNE